MQFHKIFKKQTGQFLLEASRPREAAESFVRAAHLAPADFEAVFNAATTLREVKELDRAELFYRKAVELRPQVRSKFTTVELSFNQLKVEFVI